MDHLHQLITDLALILGSAGIITIIFKKLKQPVVLGYIIAGLLVSPNFKIFPTIADTDSIRVWADIGVIFLLFSLGLEFSFKKLVKIGPTAGITGFFEVTMMVITGYITGRLMGWNTIDSIFLGGIISISSTTIIIRAFEELGMKTRKFAGMVFGVLVIEDLAAVLLLVLLSTVAVSKNFSGGQMLFSVLKLAFFLILWFVAGIYLLPTFLKRTGKLMNEETLLIVSLGLCLIMVALASQVGFSSALGAFIMGSILAETSQNEKIIRLVKPVKDLFGAIFFVSVGMLINLSVLAQYILPVLLLTLVVIAGKTVYASVGSLIAGQPLKQSVQTGMSLSQIGEFSFIIATLGLTLKVTSSFLYPIAVGVSVLTTFCSPYLIRLSGPFYQWLEKHLPKEWLAYLNRYSTGAQKIKSVSSWRKLIRAYLRAIIINTVIIIGIILITTNYLKPFLNKWMTNSFHASVFSTVITLLAIAPFLWALTIHRIERLTFTKLWLDKVYNRGPLLLLEIVRVGLCVLIIGFLLNSFFSVRIALMGAILSIVIVIFFFSRKLQSFYGRIEKRFLTNLHGSKPESTESSSLNLVPWDGHLTYFNVPSESPSAGKTLAELAWRENFGITIALIERGQRTIHTPGRDERIFPADRIGVIGSDEQLENFSRQIQITETNNGNMHPEKLGLVQILIHQNSPLAGKSIRNSGIRNEARGLVVGIERNGLRELNPDSSFIFESGDVVWVAGNKDLLKKLE